MVLCRKPCRNCGAFLFVETITLTALTYKKIANSKFSLEIRISS